SLLTSEKLPVGNVPFTLTYDSQGRVTSQVVAPTASGATNFTTTIVYDGAGGTTLTDGLGKITKYVADSSGNITQVVDPLGNTARLTFDSSGRLQTLTDKTGGKTSYTYDPASGLIASLTDAAGNKTSYTYTSQSQGGFTFYLQSGVTYANNSTSSK